MLRFTGLGIQLAMAVVLNDDISMETKRAEATVNLHDVEKRGMMIVDWNSDKTNVTIVTKVDKEKFNKEIPQGCTVDIRYIR